MTGMTSTKPYLFRGIFEWIEDNGMTPHIVVDALGDGVLVPQDYVEDGQITLNIASSSIDLYQMDNELVHFSARFNGVSQELTVPMTFILGIYARENGQGMFFEAEEYPDETLKTSKPRQLDAVKPILQEQKEKSPNKTQTANKKSISKKTGNKDDAKRDSSHLKIIK